MDSKAEVWRFQVRDSAPEALLFWKGFSAGALRTIATRLASGNGRLARSTASATPRMAALPPIPSASEVTAMAVNPGLLRSMRSP